MHTQGSVDCLHCLISTTAQNQERKEGLFATTASNLVDGVTSKCITFQFCVQCFFF